MPKIELSILIDNTPTKEQTENCKESPEQVVRRWIEEVEAGGNNSGYAFARLSYLFKRLAALEKLTPKMKRIFDMIEPIMAKSPDKKHIQATYPHERED
jgi:hypothetical protein